MKALKQISLLFIILLAGYNFAHAQTNEEDAHAKAMRLSLDAGGMNTKGHPLLSKNYGPFLIKKGFSSISLVNYIPKRGDIRVFQPYPGGEACGFIDGYDGYQWISDYKEDNFWPSAKYKKYHPAYQVFRDRKE